VSIAGCATSRGMHAILGRSATFETEMPGEDPPRESGYGRSGAVADPDRIELWSTPLLDRDGSAAGWLGVSGL